MGPRRQFLGVAFSIITGKKRSGRQTAVRLRSNGKPEHRQAAWRHAILCFFRSMLRRPSADLFRINKVFTAWPFLGSRDIR